MRLQAAALAILLGSPSIAQETATFTYQMFETAVLHVNLAECPGELAGEARFCRMTMHNDAFHVFAFSEDGEQPMIGFKSWYEDEMEMTFN